MLTEEQVSQLHKFQDRSNFKELGAVIIDLDGTAIDEVQGKFFIPKEIQNGLKKIYELGRPIIFNTLRFPLSVVKTFGKDLYSIYDAPVPIISMKGSQLGYINQNTDGKIIYDEIIAFPLKKIEIDGIIEIVDEFVSQGINDLLLFYYPRNWTKGEIIWAPVKDKISEVEQKYQRATFVYCEDLNQLQNRLYEEDICMILLMIDLPQDKLMLYRHAKSICFFTMAGTDKLSGTKSMSKYIQFELPDSIGAGDTEMDTFLKGVGQAIVVGNCSLNFDFRYPAIRVSGSTQLGELLYELAIM